MTARLYPPLGREDHILGPPTPPGAPLELVMYGDFQCPYCIAAQGIVVRVRSRLGDRLRFAYRHFPVVELHPDAQRAAEAAEAAAAQGSFWPMHDALFACAGQLAEKDVLRCAARIGLDERRVAQELRAHVHAPRVARDVDSGRRSGVTATPTFFAQGRRVDGAFDVRSLIEALAPGEPAGLG